ncbi:hypothetical protein [Clostridium sp.]|uniref:hypothetical protein n=1 Tax=Clostridium sp. TaxID=1506 RepID=UPI001A3C4A46|nr:hypothetical protein [Clostridium sp.]MBK5243287.1 hypothetical protein [Clostridium sp.]
MRCAKVLYNVEQIANLTKVSKVTIYRKLKLNQVKPYIITKQGKAYVDEHGFHVITELLNVITNDTDNVNHKETEQAMTLEEQDLSHETSCNNNVIIGLKSEIDFLRNLLEKHSSKSEISFLHSQLEEKDRQLESKDKLLENMQILVKDGQNKQQNDIPLLEAHFVELDEKIGNIKKEMDNRRVKSESNKQKKSFFKFLKH